MMGDILHPQYKFFHHFIFVWATGAQSHLYNPLLEVLDRKSHCTWISEAKIMLGVSAGQQQKSVP